MKMTFNPTLLAVTANLIAGMKVSNNVYRFRAEVSSIADKDGWKKAVASLLGDDLKLVETACFQIDTNRQSGVGVTVEAFATFSPTTHYVAKSELASTLEKIGKGKMVANMYMTDDEAVWRVTQAGNSMVITKEGSDDIEALLASANETQNSQAFDQTCADLITADGLGMIGFVHDNGLIEAAFSVNRTVGDPTRLQVLRVEDLKLHGKAAQPIVISALQVIAFEDLPDLDSPEDFDGLNPLEYYRSIWSNDPETMRMLETYIGDMHF
jgi:hypothetical protein